MNPEQTKHQPEKQADEPQHQVTQEQPQQQPVQQLQPQQQPQYIVTRPSLNGIGGWLVFWIVVFALSSVSMLGAFISQLSGETAQDIVLMVFSPIMLVLSLGSAITIPMRLKLARWLSIATLLTAAIYTAVAVFTNELAQASISASVTTVLVSFIIYGLLSLYFIKSERVHQTLIK